MQCDQQAAERPDMSPYHDDLFSYKSHPSGSRLGYSISEAIMKFSGKVLVPNLLFNCNSWATLILQLLHIGSVRSGKIGD